MRYALTSDAIRVAEHQAAEQIGISLAELMERAGKTVAEQVTRVVSGGPVGVLVGRGNNGGDGWVAARLLHEAAQEVFVVTSEPPSSLDGISGEAARRAEAAGVEVRVVGGAIDKSLFVDCRVVVDALFGIGFVGDVVREPYDTWIAAINDSDAYVVSVDIPSGVHADTGQTVERAVRADLTVALIAPKPGSLMYPGAAYSGKVVTSDLGVPVPLIGMAGDLELWDEADYARLLPVHAPDVHKNARGRVLVVAGSGAYPGAAMLAAMGAQRTGAGYVMLAVPESVAATIQGRMPSVVTVGLAESRSRTFASRAADELLDLAREFDAVVMGPGLTVAHGAVLAVRRFVSGLNRPLVLDADGLNALVDAVDLLSQRTAPTVITPHPGELARLLDVTPTEVQSDRLSYGARLSGVSLACVLKG
ncbi:MAG: NAD(P)H-hydrate epimerase, partial [Coriobacteriia bacterium]|nr:NAD(P)H-hydrate epimerase [Coriobacteriia bacterium]